MEAHAISKADYLDILFDNRNKAYGGYQLRKQQGQRMNKALLMVVGLCTAIVGYSMLPDTKPTVQTPPVIERVVELVDKDDIIPPKPPKPEIPAPEPHAVKPTQEFLKPVIKPDELVTTPPVTIDSLIGKDPGPVTIKGDPNGNVVAKGPTESGNGTHAVEPPKVQGPRDWSEIMPSYNGNINAYLAKNIHYPAMAMQSNISGRVLVKFVVNENGSVDDVHVLRGIGGGCDEEALRVVKNMPKWKPGMQNGTPVKVYFTLPIVFRLE